MTSKGGGLRDAWSREDGKEIFVSKKSALLLICNAYSPSNCARCVNMYATSISRELLYS
jgi:hypothetical protein